MQMRSDYAAPHGKLPASSNAQSPESLRSIVRETEQQLAECFAYYEQARHLLGPGERQALAKAVCVSLEHSLAVRSRLDLRTGKAGEAGNPRSESYDEVISLLERLRQVSTSPSDTVAFDILFSRLHRSLAEEARLTPV